MNEITNTRIIPFSQHKSLDLRLHGENKITLRERTFCFFKRKIILSYVFQGKKKTYFFTFVFRKRERKCILSLSSFPQREFSEREREFSLKREKKNFFFLNSGRFCIVLKLPKTAPLISPINWVGLGRVGPLGHPNPTPTLGKKIRGVDAAASKPL